MSSTILHLPHDIFLIICDFLYPRIDRHDHDSRRRDLNSRHTNLTSTIAFNIGLFRQVNRHFKNVLDIVYVFDNTQFYSLTGELALTFLSSSKKRRGVVSRFHRQVSCGLPVPLHLDLSGLNFKTCVINCINKKNILAVVLKKNSSTGM